MPKNLLILPNQLFQQIKNMESENIILYEAAEYFTKYNYNQKKIVLHRASMQNFYGQLKEKLQKTKLSYFDYKSELQEVIKGFETLTIFDPINKDIKNKIKATAEAE